MKDQEINFSLTVDEANVILNSLGNMPYSQVFQLINKIQMQAQQQMDGAQMVSTNGAESKVED